MKQAPNFFIHYELDESESLDLESFGKSIIGFNTLLKDIFHITKIDADIDIRTLQPKKGSIIVQLIIEIGTHHQCLFHNLRDLQNFLQVVDTGLLTQANDYFSDVGFSETNQIEFWKKIWNGKTDAQIGFNKFENERGGEFWLYTGLSVWLLFQGLPKFFMWTIGKVKGIKNKVTPDDSIPKDYFSKLKQLPKKNKKPLQPIREGAILEIGFSLDGKRDNRDNDSIINANNLGEFLSDDEEVLPQLQNGGVYKFTGEIKNFQSSRGDFMKIQIYTEHGKFLLTAKPSYGFSTKEFIVFYKEHVVFQAEILRDSLYQLPKLKIIPGSMELKQKVIEHTKH